MNGMTDQRESREEQKESAKTLAQGTELVPFTLVIPAYNEEHAIGQTLRQLLDLLPAAGSWEIIVVDDGSTDNTAVQARTLPGIKVLSHETNRGYGAALKTGIRNANYDLIAIIDADGTYPLEQLPRLVALSPDCDMVVGARTGAKVSYPKIRTIGKYGLIKFAEWIAYRRIPDINSGMRVFRKAAAMRFIKLLPDSFSFTLTITLAMLTNGYRVKFEPIDYYPRIGKSKIKPIKDTLRFIQLILRTGAYFAPLRVFLPVSGFIFIAALLSLGYDIALFNLTDTTVILMVTSVQIGMFALLADMIVKRSAA